VTEFTFFVYTKGNKRLKTNDRALASSWTNNQRINSIDNQKNKIKEAPCGCLFSVQFKRPSNKSGRFHPQRKKMLLAQAKFHRVNKYKKCDSITVDEWHHEINPNKKLVQGFFLPCFRVFRPISL
jgi:hypothetical protein